MPMPGGPHAELLEEALAVEAEGQSRLLAGDGERGAAAMRRAAELYRASWQVAPPASYGRLIGMLKAAIIAGEPTEAACYAREQLDDEASSAAACYVRAIAALALDDDQLALRASAGMRQGSDAFIRAAEAIAGLAQDDAERYARALGEIVADFQARERHLTGVAIADTALMLQRLASRRGMACACSSPLLPASV